MRRGINYLARENLFRLPVVGWVLRQWNVVPVDREGGGAKGLKAILDRLLAGGAIIVFPEGTRSRDGRLQPARSGIGLTVIKSAAPVIPVRVFGTFEAYGRPPNPITGKPPEAKTSADLLRLTLEAMDRYNIKLGMLSGRLEAVYAWKAKAPDRFLASVAFSGRPVMFASAYASTAARAALLRAPISIEIIRYQ